MGKRNKRSKGELPLAAPGDSEDELVPDDDDVAFVKSHRGYGAFFGERLEVEGIRVATKRRKKGPDEDDVTAEYERAPRTVTSRAENGGDDDDAPKTLALPVKRLDGTVIHAPTAPAPIEGAGVDDNMHNITPAARAALEKAREEWDRHEKESKALDAAEAGAAIIHLHARDPADGRPTPDPEMFMQFLPTIRDGCDAVINITTGGGHGMTLDERLAAPLRASPEMCSLNMGSMNFGLFPMLQRYDEFRYEWERAHLENSRDFIFRNTFKDIEHVLQTLGEGCGTRFEFECYDIGHLYNLAHFLDRGLVKPPLFVQSIFGILGGIGADPENVTHMRRIADKLFGDDYVWSLLAGGRHQLPLVTMSAIMGGNVRVGLEDSLYAGKGQLATSNAEQVSIIRRVVERLSMDIASADEAREMLALKGADQVGF